MSSKTMNIDRKWSHWTIAIVQKPRQAISRRRRGAIAVETAVLMPLVIFAFLTALDLGLQVHHKQNLTKAAKSGLDIIHLGSRSEASVHDVVQSVLHKPVDPSNIHIQAACACIQTYNPAGPEITWDPSDGESGTVSEINPEYQFFYSKTPTVLGTDMCAQSCEGGDAPIPLVDLQIDDTFRGLYSERNMTARLQARLK